MLFATVSASAVSEGFFIHYSLPIIWDSFNLVQIKTIPFFPVSNNSFVKLHLEDELVCVNHCHFFFPFNANLCRFRVNLYLCDGRRLSIHTFPKSCAKELLFIKDTNPGLGHLCKEQISVTSTGYQQYIHHHDENTIIVFLPL